jgi:hypothetical protein
VQSIVRLVFPMEDMFQRDRSHQVGIGGALFGSFGQAGQML